MSDVHLYSMTESYIQENINLAKECLLFALEREGLLKRPAEDIAKEYALVVHRKNWLGSIIAKMKGETGTKLNVDVVKLV